MWFHLFFPSQVKHHSPLAQGQIAKVHLELQKSYETTSRNWNGLPKTAQRAHHGARRLEALWFCVDRMSMVWSLAAMPTKNSQQAPGTDFANHACLDKGLEKTRAGWIYPVCQFASSQALNSFSRLSTFEYLDPKKDRPVLPCLEVTYPFTLQICAICSMYVIMAYVTQYRAGIVFQLLDRFKPWLTNPWEGDVQELALVMRFVRMHIYECVQRIFPRKTMVKCMISIRSAVVSGQLQLCAEGAVAEHIGHTLMYKQHQTTNINQLLEIFSSHEAPRWRSAIRTEISLRLPAPTSRNEAMVARLSILLKWKR